MNHDQNLLNRKKLFSDPQVFLRLWGLYMLFAFLSLALGIAFFLIAIGFIHVILWFAFYWEPAYKVLVKALNIPPSDRIFVKLLLLGGEYFR